MKVTIDMDYNEYDLINFMLKKRSEEMDELARNTKHQDCKIYYEQERDFSRALKSKLEKSYFKL